MHVRFRKVGHRLIVALVAREGRKVRSEHRLGSIQAIEPPAMGDRVAFWGDLSRRFHKIEARRGKLASDELGQMLIAIDARVPRPTPAERKAAQVEARAARERAAGLITSVRDGAGADAPPRQSVDA